MDLGIKGRPALVTGAGRGIGRAIAKELAKEGTRVAVVARTRSDIDSLIEEMGGASKGHYGTTLDLMEDGALGLLVDNLLKECAQPDIVVHNLGGTLDVTDPFCSVADWRRVWRFNVEIAIELDLLLLPGMRKARWGRVVHISSMSGLENQGPIPYCAAKAAVIAYTRSMSRFLAPEGVIITTVLPGAVITEKGYWDQTRVERPQHYKKYIEERMAIKRLGTPEEIAPMVAFLCSEHASFCVGSAVPIDGGQGRSFFAL